MPSSVNINGLRIYRPGIYAIIDASSLGGKGISTGNVAIVGDFPELEHGGMGGAATDVKSLTFSSAPAVNQFNPTKKWLDISKIAFSPSSDGRVPGGAATLTFVNQMPNSQAKSAGYGGFQSIHSTEALELQSRLWGKTGNRVFVEMKTNADDANLIDATIKLDGKSEVFSAQGSGPIMDLWYSGSDLTTSWTEVGPKHLHWSWTKALPLPSASDADVVWEPTHVVSSGAPLEVMYMDGASGAQTSAKTLKVEGLNAAGIATTEELSTNSGANTNQIYASSDIGGTPLYQTATSWSRIDKVTVDGSAAANGTWTLSGTAFDIDMTDFLTLGAVVSYINNNSTKGFNAESQHVRINTIPAKPSAEWPYAGGLDSSNGNTLGAGNKLTVRADNWAIVSSLDSSQFVKCKAATPSTTKAECMFILKDVASLNGQKFTLTDGTNTQEFEFDNTKNGVANGTIGVQGEDLEEVADSIVASINDASITLNITATSMGAADGEERIRLVMDAGGEGGNQLIKLEEVFIVDSLSTTNFFIPRFSGGSTLGYQLPPKQADGGASSDTFLFGGGVGSVTSASIDEAYKAIEAADIQIVVPMPGSYAASDSNLVDHYKKAVTHCVDSAIAGYERNVWAGASEGNTPKELFDTFTKKLNSRHLAMVGQEIQITNSKGNLEWFSPQYLALMCACMQAGSVVATPLTWKRPSVVDVRQKWNSSLDAGEAIARGLCVLSEDTLGWKIERSVTTHMEDDNPIYSEVSSMESVNTSVRALRNQLLIQIGNPIYSNTAPKMASKVDSVLDRQVQDGIIKAYQNVVLEDLGDTIRITYEVAAVEPLNFIIIVANVTRIAST